MTKETYDMISAISYMQTDSALGIIWMAATSTGLCCIHLGNDSPEAFFDWIHRHLPDRPIRENPAALTSAATQVEEYLAGKRRTFELVRDVHGTDFQRAVWAQVERVPYGCTATYGQIARLVGRPTASRAVGAAVGANPLPIVVPCHRVVGSSGALVGYGGGLSNKETLLKIERDHHS